MILRTSNDRKVSVHHGMSIGNSFGLPAGISCPGATSVCDKVCYAKKIERMPYLKAVRDNLRHNWDTLSQASRPEMIRLLDEMIGEWRTECIRRGKDLKFRIHWDGDFFSADYAIAWATVISVYPDVQFWAYTRSFDLVGHFFGLSNLSLYLSVDSENIVKAAKTRKDFPFVRWAYLDETMADAAEVMIAETGKPGAMCPENIGRIPLIEKKKGACISCNLCVAGKADIRFAVRKR